MNRRFAAKIYLTFWIIVLSAILFATVYQAAALNRDYGRMASSLRTKLPSIVLIGSIAQFFLFRICRSIQNELSEISRKDKVSDSQVISVQKKMKQIELVFILVNSVGFFFGPGITFIIYAAIGRTYPPFEIFFIIANHMLVATAGTLLQISLVHIIFQDILKSFKVYKAISELKSMPVMKKRIGVFAILLVLPMFLLAGFFYGAVATGALNGSGASSLVWEFLLHCAVYSGFMLLIFLVLSKEEQNKLKALQSSLDDNLSAHKDEFGKLCIISHDDYADLASAINEYTGRLELLVANISTAGKTVGRTTMNLQESIAKSEHSLEHMKDINFGISSVVAQETQAVSEASKAIEAISDSVDKVDYAVLQQASFVEESSAAITQMNANIVSVVAMANKAAQETQTLNGNITEGSKRLGESLASMEKLKEASVNVQTVVGVIQTIAAQINLLAMNAAIEAAHAGDSGRGFAVVALEVRKLAEQSSKSVKEIRSMIKDMIQAIESGAASSQQTGEAFARITEAVEVTSQVISSVSAAMEEQRAGAGEIKSSMEALVRATESIQAEVKQQTENNKEMNTAFGSLLSAVKHLEEKTKEQQEEDGHLVHVIEDLHSVNRQNSEAVTHLVSAVDF